MFRIHLLRRTIPLMVLAAVYAGSPASALTMDGHVAVITIYNKSSIYLDYQLRVWQDGEWGRWESHTHVHPRGGWHWHSFPNAEFIQIRFDRIGGDDEYTEKVYDLDFNGVGPDTRLCRHKGRPYKFEFDRGGRLLDLYRYGW